MVPYPIEHAALPKQNTSVSPAPPAARARHANLCSPNNAATEPDEQPRQNRSNRRAHRDPL
eukprot:2860293-Lingulodinium_polyedra.AAC.1